MKRMPWVSEKLWTLGFKQWWERERLRILKAGVSGLEGQGGERGGLNEKCPP